MSETEPEVQEEVVDIAPALEEAADQDAALDVQDEPGAAPEVEEDEDLPTVVVDSREPVARTLKRLGLNAHDELVSDDRSANEDRLIPGGTEE